MANKLVSINGKVPVVNEKGIEVGVIEKEEQSKTLTLGASAPATVTPDSGKVLSSVPIVLDTSVIKAENIKKDVTMLGVTGTHEGGGGETANLTFDFMGGDGAIGVMTVGETYGYAVYNNYTSYGDFQNRYTGVLSIPVPQLIYAAYNSMGGTGHFTGNVTNIAGYFWLVTGDCDFNGGGIA